MPSAAIQMLYSKIVLQQGVPFDLHLPTAHLTVIEGMARTELDTNFAKGIESMNSSQIYSVDEKDAELAKEFGI